MNCTEFLDRYSDFDDSLLTPAEEAVFREHLASCPPCDRYDRVLRKGRMLARQLDTDPAPDFMPRLQRRILAVPATPAATTGPVAAGGFLTLALVAVMGVWLVDGQAVGSGVGLAHGAARYTSLPVAAHIGPADWTAGRVDRRSPSSYSPVVIGPPAFRAHRSVSTDLMSATSHTLD